jgi:hypothetical protein
VRVQGCVLLLRLESASPLDSVPKCQNQRVRTSHDHQHVADWTWSETSTFVCRKSDGKGASVAQHENMQMRSQCWCSSVGFLEDASSTHCPRVAKPKERTHVSSYRYLSTQRLQRAWQHLARSTQVTRPSSAGSTASPASVTRLPHLEVCSVTCTTLTSNRDGYLDCNRDLCGLSYRGSRPPGTR